LEPDLGARVFAGLDPILVADSPHVAHLLGRSFEDCSAGKRGAERPTRFTNPKSTLEIVPGIDVRGRRLAREQLANELKGARGVAAHLSTFALSLELSSYTSSVAERRPDTQLVYFRCLN